MFSMRVYKVALREARDTGINIVALILTPIMTLQATVRQPIKTTKTVYLPIQIIMLLYIRPYVQHSSRYSSVLLFAISYLVLGTTQEGSGRGFWKLDDM